MICKLIGHSMRQEMQGTDNSTTKKDGYIIHKKIITCYVCKRCCYTFTNTINFTSSLNSDEWISVKDRFPQNDEYVLTYCDCSVKSVRSNWYSTDRKIWHEGDDNITHWMPLPPPPLT